MAKSKPVDQINVSLKIPAGTLDLALTVPSKKVKLRAMLPVVRSLSNSFIEASVKEISASGESISCKAGCGACCRQMVPVSEAEAYDISRTVAEMPEPRRSQIKERFSSGLEKFEASGFFDRLDDVALNGSEADYETLIEEYFDHNVECPFLESGSCSIHPVRPITCREYLVTSPAELCDSSKGTGIVNIKQFFQVKESLISLAREKTAKSLPYVPLIKVLEWTASNLPSTRERTGRDWMERFFSELSRFSST